MSINFSLVLPCYNEENIAFLWWILSLPMDDYKAELILVNNGSEDRTQDEINKAIKKIIQKVLLLN